MFGRSIGLITSLAALTIVNSGSGNLSMIAWGLALIIEIVVYFTLKYTEKAK